MPDIFDEVEEELRAERARQLLQRYAGLILVLALLVVGGVAAWRVYDWYLAKQDGAAASLYIAALEQQQAAGTDAGRTKSTVELRKLAATAPEGYRDLARLQSAAILAKDGKLDQALGLWNALASDNSADPLLRQLATLLWTQHQIDGGDPAALQARLRPLAQLDSPWRAEAEKQLALLDLRESRTDAAKATLRGLANDATAPRGVRGQASLLLSQIGG